MNKTKSTFIIVTLLFFTAYSQTGNQLLSEAMSKFNSGEYSKAFDSFCKLSNVKNDNIVITELADYYKADCLLALNNIDGAISEYEYFIENHPTSEYRSIALYKLGIIFFEQLNYEKSIEKCMSLIEDYPGSDYSGYAYYWIGESFTETGKNYEAEEYLLEAYEKNKKTKYADYTLFALSKVYEKGGKYDKAIEYYDELLSHYWDSDLTPLAKLRIGICYFQQKDFNNSILELSDPLIDELPEKEKFQAEYLLANSQFKLREYAGAKQSFNEVLKEKYSDEYKEQIDYGLAWVNFQLEEYNQSFKTFSKLSDSQNDTLAASALYWSGECKRYNGEMDAALNILENYLDKYPRHYLASTAQYNIGLIYYSKNDYRRAEEYFLSVIQETDKNVNGKAYTLLGGMSLNNSNYEEARDYFQRAIELSGNKREISNQSKFGLGVALYYLNEYKKSVDILNDLNAKNHLFEKNSVNFYLAEDHFKLENFEAALRHYLRVSSPDSTQLGKQTLYGKAYTYYNLKDFSNAAYYLNEYLNKYKKDENYTDVKLRLADSYYGLKDFSRASEIYNSLFNRERRNVDDDNAYYQYGQALFKSGNYSQAIDEFASIQKRFPRSRYRDDSQYIIGWIYFRQDRFQEAIDNYNKLLETYPSSALRPITYYSIGDALYNLGEYDAAIQSYTRIINEFPKTEYVFDAINGIQYCYLAIDEPDKAVELIDRFVQSSRDYQYNDQILFKKGEIYYSLGEYQKSQNGYKEFLSAFPKSSLVPNAYYWIGKCEQNLGNIVNALSHFEYIVSNFLSSEYGVSAVLEVAKIKGEAGEKNEVINLFNAAINKLPGSPRLAELIYNKGMAQVNAGVIKDAYQTFYEVTQYYTESIFTEKSKIELGKLELENNRFESAEILFNEAGANRIDDIGAMAQYYYGVALMKQDKISDAITVLVRVKSIFTGYDEWYTKSLIALGDCYLSIGDKKEAREMYRSVLSRHSNDEFSIIAKEKINSL